MSKSEPTSPADSSADANGVTDTTDSAAHSEAAGKSRQKKHTGSSTPRRESSRASGRPDRIGDLFTGLEKQETEPEASPEKGRKQPPRQQPESVSAQAAAPSAPQSSRQPLDIPAAAAATPRPPDEPPPTAPYTTRGETPVANLQGLGFQSYASLEIGSTEDQVLPATAPLTSLSWESLRQGKPVIGRAQGAHFMPGDSEETTLAYAVPYSHEVGTEESSTSLLLEFLDDNDQRLWSEDELQLVEQVSDQLTLALENARLFEETQSRAEELAILNEMSRTLSAQLNLQDVYETIYSYTSRLLNTENFFIAIYDPQNDEISFPLVQESRTGEPGQRIEWRTRKSGNGLTEYVTRTRQPVLIRQNVAEWVTKHLKIELIGQEAQSWLGVPMIFNEQAIGIIAVQSYVRPLMYTENHRDLLSAVANQAAVSITNARLYTEEQRRRQIADGLSEIARAVSSTLDASTSAQRVLDELARLIDFHSATIQLVQGDDRQTIAARYYEHLPQEALPGSDPDLHRPISEDPLIRQVVETRQPLLLADTHNDERWEIRPETAHVRSWIATPLIVLAGSTSQPDAAPASARQADLGSPTALASPVVGLLIIDHIHPNAYDQSSVELLSAVAAQVSVAIQNARLFAQTENARDALAVTLAETDALYQASARLNSAENYAEILDVLRQHTLLGSQQVSQISLNIFDRPWSGLHKAEWFIPLAQWSAHSYSAAAASPTGTRVGVRASQSPRPGSDSPGSLPAGPLESGKTAAPEIGGLSTRLPIAAWGSAEKLLRSDQPTIVSNILADPRLDETTRRRLQEQMLSGSSSSPLGAPARPGRPWALVLAPLNVAGQWIGHIIGVYNQESSFEDQAVRRLTTLARQAAVAVQNLHSIEIATHRAQEAQQRSEELALINRVVASVAGSLDLQASLTAIANEIGQALSVQTTVSLLNEERAALTIMAAASHSSAARSAASDAAAGASQQEAPASMLGLEIPLRDNPAAQTVIRTRRTLVIDDPQNDPLAEGLLAAARRVRPADGRPADGTQAEAGTHLAASAAADAAGLPEIGSVMLIPIISANRVVGTFELDITDPGRSFSKEEINLAETVVLQAATALDNARLFRQTQQALAETEVLYNASAELNAAQNYAGILQTLRRHSALGAVDDYISLELFDQPWIGDETPESIQVTAEDRGVTADDRQAEKTTSGPALSSAPSHYALRDLPVIRTLLRPSAIPSAALLAIDDPAHDLRLDEKTRQFYRARYATLPASLVFVPLVAGGAWIGFIHAMYNQRSRLADDEIRRLEVLAGQAAVAAQSLRQLEQIQKRAQYEYLTREIGGQISSTIERDTILRTTARSLAQALEASHVIIEIVAPGLIGQIPVEADQPARPSQLSHLSESARRKAARQSETARRKPAPSSIDERPLRPLVPERAETAQTRAQLSSRSEPSNTPQQNMLLYSYSRHAASATAPSGEETAEDEFLITSFRTGVEQPNDPRSLLKDLSPGYMYVPILLRGELIGSIQVYDVNQNREWSEEDQTLLNTVSSQSALALDNARLFQETQTALSETETLYQAGARLNAAQSFDEILQTLGQYTMLGQADKLLTLTLFNRPWGSSPDTEDAALGALLPSSSEWKTEFAGIPEWNTAIASTTTLPPENLRHRYALREFPAVRLLSPTEPLIVSDISTDPRLDKESRRLYQDNFQGSSAIIAPLYVGGLWIGTIMGVFGQSQTFNEGQVRRLMALAGQAAVAVQNLQSVELAEQRAREAQQRSEELALVNRIIAAVSAASDLQSSLDTMAEELGKALGLQNGIALFDEGRQSLTLVAAYNLDSSPVSPTKDGVESAELLPSDLLGIRIPVEGNLSTQKVIETHRTLLIEDVANNPLTAEIKQMLSERGVHSMAILPLMAGTQMIGTVGLDILEIGRKLTPEEIRLAETIVFQTGTTIQNARLFEQTQQVLAETDTLYQASTEFNLAKDYAQIINTLYTHTVLGQGTPPLQAHNLSLVVFDRPWVGENMPEWAIPLARHGDPTVASFSDRYLLSAFPAARTLMGPDRITVIENLDTDPRLDHNTRRLYTQNFKAKSAIFAPLVVGGQWIGYLNAMYPESMQPAQISEKELRRVTILAGQSAVAVQNIRLLEESRRRAGQLQTAAEIARDTSGTLALDSLLQRSVSLLRERFGYYHASVFLIDEIEYMAVLAESTGEAGEEMKRRQHKLAVGSRSVIGQVTSEGMPVVLNDVTTEEARSIHKPNPLLPNTKAELGIPLKIADRVIGALDVQSAQANAFSTDEIAVLQILSDQIAVAVETARTYELVQKAAEELREADRLKSQFLANMSHELRTPLNSIIGFSRVILKGIDGPISDLQQQDLNAIYNSGQHLLGLINDVLDLSKIEAGKMELSFEDNINLTDIIKGVLSTTMGLLKDKPVQLHQEVEPHLPLLRIDAMKVRQVLINLLSNASKFTEEGSITVRATTQTAQSGSREVLVEVIDTGPGIALEDQEKLFKPFSQVDGSLTRKTGGSGLGLSICDHLIRMHGGKVSLTSEVGKGSIFYFTLPVPPEKAIESEPIQDHAPHQSPEPSHGVAAAQQTAPAAEKQPQQNQSAPEKIETLTEPLARQPRQRTEPSTTSEQKQPQEEPPVKLPPDLQDQDKSLETIKNAGLIILTIDQDHQVTDMYRRYLANHNCTAIALTELGQAATVAKGIQPNMITLDVAMRSKKVLPPGEKGIPDPDGWQVLEELKSDPGTRNIPVIVCSLLDDPAVRERAKNLGADEYLLKPILEEDLMGTIQRLYFSARSGSGTRQRKEQS